MIPAALSGVPRASLYGIGERNDTLTDERRAELLATCQQFESFLVNTMLTTMRETIPEGGLFEKSHAESLFTSMLDTEYAKVASTQRPGGLGLAGSMYEQLAKESLSNVPDDPQMRRAIEQRMNTGFSSLPPMRPDQFPKMSSLDNGGLIRSAQQLNDQYAQYGRKFTAPISTGEISSEFGMRKDPFTGEKRMHQGVDIAAPIGTPIQSVGSGTVTFAGDMGGYGNVVIVQHAGGFESRYAHASALLVREGDQIQAGDTIALVGSTGRSTGPHLHFEIRKDSQAINPALHASLPKNSANYR
ncbi:peptidoglycan DD-metalloendopeptidase family protein [Chrysiogenes arsenatis]|uniref:peptidoglycan DD-metalloendopeptidase family protein n=1 Tax=Chrysiogenes arsenatis TaxID=309797 RepID=UPI00041EBC32|nr:peptidoglycan DD-metalloendopeptidase family protein [Chrysiogenes arsenatis]